MPNKLFARDKFCDFLFGTVHIFVAIRELGSEFAGVALYFSWPLSAWRVWSIEMAVVNFCSLLRPRQPSAARKLRIAARVPW